MKGGEVKIIADNIGLLLVIENGMFCIRIFWNEIDELRKEVREE
jgi:hypothetical protein